MNVTLADAAAALVAIAAGLVTIAKAWDLINKHLHPEADMRPTLNKHGELLDKDKRRLDTHDVALDDMHKGISVLCKTQLALLNHEISGNDLERLKEARSKLNEYLVNR